MTIFSPLSTQPVYLSQRLQVGAIIQVFDAQTLTPRTVYKDGLAAVPWLQATPTSPVPAGALVTDVNGTIPVFFVQGNPYRVRITAASGVQIRDVDNLPGDVSQGGGGGGGGGSNFNTGDYVYSHTTAVVTGRVRCNGRTIGSASSGATERANSDTQNLFVFLWNADPLLTVSGGRGVSGAADFSANKTIQLPDFNGRGLIAIDGMGTSSTGRLAGGLFSIGNSGTLGSAGGEGAHALLIAELAAHTHTGTTLGNTAFQMSGSTGLAGGHSHSASSDLQGSHSHGGLTATENVAHSHGFTTGSAGVHSHGGATGAELNSFTMSAVGVALSANPVSVPTVASGAGGFVSVVQTSGSGITLGSSGVENSSHTHSISSDGSHTHSGTTGTESANHAHVIFSDGVHNHTISVASVSDHSHTFVTNLGGVHTHAFTTASVGSGTAHNNLAPFGLATLYMVL